MTRRKELPGKSTAPTEPLVSHIKPLDGLRGIAVLLVMFYHAGYLAFGWAGVQLFFVLSGFLITRILVKQKALRGRDYFSRFYRSQPRRTLLGRLTSWQGLRSTGAISYGMYLFHWPLLWATCFFLLGERRIPREVPWHALVVFVGVTWLTAWLSYRFYERRFLRYKSRSLQPVSA